MKNILGIGVAGCNIVEQLSQYPVYQSFYISNEIKKTSKFKFSLPEHSGPEEYEMMEMDHTQEEIVGFIWAGVPARVPQPPERPDISTYIRNLD